MILEQALKCCRNCVFWSTIITSQWWVNVAVISPTLNQPPHLQILQQKLIPVTSDFLSPTTFLSGRSKVVGDRIYCISFSEICVMRLILWYVDCHFSMVTLPSACYQIFQSLLLVIKLLVLIYLPALYLIISYILIGAGVDRWRLILIRYCVMLHIFVLDLLNKFFFSYIMMLTFLCLCVSFWNSSIWAITMTPLI